MTLQTIRAQRGMLAKIAADLGVTRAAVAKWTRVPAERVADVARVSGIPDYELRPDLFRRPAEPAAAAPAVAADRAA